jgi:dTDP-4-amino-4,6-dideoxygalactose transaminase
MSISASQAHSSLAINGGKPIRSDAFAPWPSFSEEEIQAATQVLRSGKVNYWTGDEGRNFEREYAAHVGTKHAIALANGTLALELALYALGIGSGDEVIVPSRTFVASASCVVMRGAVPVMADVDLVSGNLTAETIAAVLTPRTKAIIAVHLAGWPCDMDPILALAKQHSLKVIEDCAQAHGATYKGRPVGSIGEIGAFSFCQDKILSTGGEGGLLTTNDDKNWDRAWSYKDHGKSYEAVYHRTHPEGFRWMHESFGTNWRLTEIQSAIGRILLTKLRERVRLRRRNAAILDESFSRLPALRVVLPAEEYGHSYYKYYVYLRPERLSSNWNRDRVQAAINAEGIPCFAGSCSEIYLEKAFPASIRPPERLSHARTLGETSLMFLVHHTLSEEAIYDTGKAVTKVIEHATN